MNKAISDETFNFLEQAYRDAVEAFINDPDEVAGSHDPKEVAKRYQYLVDRGSDIGHSFWLVANEVGEKYIKRLKKILAEAGLDFPVVDKTLLLTWRDLRDKLNSLSEAGLDQIAVLAVNSAFYHAQSDQSKYPLLHFIENDPDSPLKEGETYIAFRGYV